MRPTPHPRSRSTRVGPTATSEHQLRGQSRKKARALKGSLEAGVSDVRIQCGRCDIFVTKETLQEQQIDTVFKMKSRRCVAQHVRRHMPRNTSLFSEQL